MFARKVVRPFGVLSESDVKNEVRAVDKLCDGSHINIIKIFGHGWLRNTPYYYFDMELCDSSLEDYIRDTESNSSSVDQTGELKTQIMKIMTDIACGLYFIHSQGEVHRDLKPRNGAIIPESQWLTVSFVSERSVPLENSRLWTIRRRDVRARSHH